MITTSPRIELSEEILRRHESVGVRSDEGRGERSVFCVGVGLEGDVEGAGASFDVDGDGRVERGGEGLDGGSNGVVGGVWAKGRRSRRKSVLVRSRSNEKNSHEAANFSQLPRRIPISQRWKW